MGTYATYTSMELMMPGVAFTTTGNAITMAGKMLDQAEAEINKYLSKRYDISSDTFQTTTGIPPLVRALCEQLAVGYMWQNLSRGGTSEETLSRGTELVDSVRSNLELIANYESDLHDTTGSVISDFANTAYRVQCNTSDYTPTFAEDDETSWAVDSDKLDDIESSRD